MRRTHHAEFRMAQRGFNADEVGFVAEHGQAEYRTGVKFVFLGKRDIPERFRRSHAHLEGVTVVLCPRTEALITVYRNKEAIADIRRKHKRSAKPRRHTHLAA